MNNQRGSRRRIATRIAIAIAMALFVLAIAIQATARYYQLRAERFLTDLRQLELKRSTFEDAERLRQKYHSYSKANKECVHLRCDFSFGFANWWWLEGNGRSPQVAKLGDKVLSLLSPLGMRLGFLQGEVLIRRGVVMGVWVQMSTTLPQHSGGGTWMLPVMADSGTALWNRLRDNETFRFGQPSACTVCEAAYARFSPEVDRDRYLRALTFQTSCFASFVACDDPKQLLPKVGPADNRKPSEAASCTLEDLHNAGRHFDSIFVVRVSTQPNSPRFELVRTLASEIVNGVEFPAGDWTISRTSALGDPEFLKAHRRLLQPAATVIVLGSTHSREVYENCPIAPATPANEDAVWQGVKERHELD